MPIAVLACLLALVALLAYGLIAERARSRARGRARPRRGASRRPRFELPTLEGDGRGTLADYRGQVVVLNFWASWCEPCREESPLLERWHRRIAGGGGTVLGVDGHDVTGDARDFIDEYELSYPMLHDGRRRAARASACSATPRPS